MIGRELRDHVIEFGHRNAGEIDVRLDNRIKHVIASTSLEQLLLDLFPCREIHQRCLREIVVIGPMSTATDENMICSQSACQDWFIHAADSLGARPGGRKVCC